MCLSRVCFFSDEKKAAYLSTTRLFSETRFKRRRSQIVAIRVSFAKASSASCSPRCARARPASRRRRANSYSASSSSALSAYPPVLKKKKQKKNTNTPRSKKKKCALFSSLAAHPRFRVFPRRVCTLSEKVRVVLVFLVSLFLKSWSDSRERRAREWVRKARTVTSAR